MKKEKLILIGASTGGPGHIEKILKKLPSTLSSRVIIAQHMDALLFDSFTKRLNSISNLEILNSADELSLDSSKIIICSKTCTLENKDNDYKLVSSSKQNHTYNPTIDILFESASNFTNNFDILCILLTGIGSDGAKGMLKLKNSGAHTIAESEESAIVYGMPRSARELGAAEKILTIDNIIDEIMRFDKEYV
ncbi:MAG: hypothetical protein QG567_1902 [Campylobacterota bacterium]|nr:hypothetical protein [Campylobacterota bacterium]